MPRRNQIWFGLDGISSMIYGMDTRLSKNESPKWIDDAVVLKADLMLRDIGINMTEPSTYVHRWQYILLPAVVVPSLKLLNQNDSSSSNLPCSMEMKYDDKILCSCHPFGIIHQTRSRAGQVSQWWEIKWGQQDGPLDRSQMIPDFGSQFSIFFLGFKKFQREEGIVWGPRSA